MENNKWEAFAYKNPEYYILTDNNDYSTKEGRKAFFKSGERYTEKTLDRVADILPDKERALEIGCGLGRLTLPHSNYFEEQMAVDISPTMLKRLKHNASKNGCTNIKMFKPNDNWWEFPVSYAYSYLVFQHIQRFETIEIYIKRMSYCLKRDGIAQLQFDTRNKGLFYRMRNHIPDPLLPKTQRSGIRKIKREAKKLRGIFRKYGLVILEEYHKSSYKHIFLLKIR